VPQLLHGAQLLHQEQQMRQLQQHMAMRRQQQHLLLLKLRLCWFPTKATPRG
jgi:hypothetical protein